jgi:UrcA family protein
VEDFIDPNETHRQRLTYLMCRMTQPLLTRFDFLTELPMKTSKTICINAFASLVASGVLVCGSSVSAQAADRAYGAQTKQVSVSDLDLSTAAGQESARERLHQMARRLCTEVEDLDDLSHHSNFIKCVATATAGMQPHLEAMIRRASKIRTAAVGPVAW